MPDLDLDLDLSLGDLDMDLDLSLGTDEVETDLMADYDYTGDVEVDAAAEMSAVKKGFIERANRENERRKAATDSEYWFCVCFQSREQVESFLAATKWAPQKAKYLDGQKLARKLSVKLPVAPDPTTHGKIKSKLANLAMEI